VKRLRKNDRLYGADEIRNILNRAESGEAYGVIAKSLSVTRSAIAGIIYRNKKRAIYPKITYPKG
jgi:hypothetical protein